MRTIHRNIVSALIFSSDGKLFQAKKDPKGGGVYLDCWHIPGGGIEKDEETLDSLFREVKEETGLDVRHYSPTLVDDVGRGQSTKILKTGETVLCNMTFAVYRIDLETTAETTPIKLCDEFVEYRWSDIADLKHLPLTPPSVELFTRLKWR